MVKEKNKKDDFAGLGVPVGLFIGMGIGFLTGNFIAWLFIGLGFGFVLMILLRLLRKNKY